MGPAGKRVAVASLNRAAPFVGYRVENPAAGPVTHLFGANVPVGPLDAAARFIPKDDAPAWLHLLIEVKNGREWIHTYAAHCSTPSSTPLLGRDDTR